MLRRRRKQERKGERRGEKGRPAEVRMRRRGEKRRCMSFCLEDKRKREGGRKVGREESRKGEKS